MYASEVKKETVERQYNYVMSLIEKYEGLESIITIDLSSVCKETIYLLLMDGFDVIKITADDSEEKVIIYEISWKNSVEGKKGEFKHVNISEELSKFNIADIEERYSSILGDNRNHYEDEYDPTEDDEGFEHYC